MAAVGCPNRTMILNTQMVDHQKPGRKRELFYEGDLEGVSVPEDRGSDRFRNKQTIGKTAWWRWVVLLCPLS